MSTRMTSMPASSSFREVVGLRLPGEFVVVLRWLFRRFPQGPLVLWRQAVEAAGIGQEHLHVEALVEKIEIFVDFVDAVLPEVVQGQVGPVGYPCCKARYISLRGMFTGAAPRSGSLHGGPVAVVILDSASPRKGHPGANVPGQPIPALAEDQTLLFHLFHNRWPIGPSMTL